MKNLWWITFPCSSCCQTLQIKCCTSALTHGQYQRGKSGLVARRWQLMMFNVAMFAAEWMNLCLMSVCWVQKTRTITAVSRTSTYCVTRPGKQYAIWGSGMWSGLPSFMLVVPRLQGLRLASEDPVLRMWVSLKHFSPGVQWRSPHGSRPVFAQMHLQCSQRCDFEGTLTMKNFPNLSQLQPHLCWIPLLLLY